MGCLSCLPHILQASAYIILFIFFILSSFSNPVQSQCKNRPVIFNFGDSNSDTGGLVAGLGYPINLPNGRNFFRRSTGRLSDGRLILDFLCQSVNTRFLCPYLDSVGSSFLNGANFAIAGSRLLPKYEPFALNIQVLQFLHFKDRSIELVSAGSGNLVGDEGFRNALFMIDIGQNDLADSFAKNLSYTEVVKMIPSFVTEIRNAIQVIYSQGGRKFWVHNTGPLGCLPQKLTLVQKVSSDLDPHGCLANYNSANFSDPLTKMDPLGYGSGTGSNFSFAYDNAAFSDRILTIQIVPNSKSDGEGCSSTAGDLDRKRKRRREETSKQNDADVLTQHKDKVLNCTMLDTEVLAYENQDEEAVAMAEESSSRVEMTTDHPGGGVASKSTDSFTHLNSAAALSVKTIRISSAILAAQSPFFYKLFSNGMRESESEKQLVTVQIYASEEAAFVKLLQFMYSNTLSTIPATAMLDVLMAADKFEVASCMRHCSRLLLNLPMTCELASLFLNLPSSVSIADAVQPLLDAAKQFLAAHFKDITKFQVEVLNLPIAGFEAVLCNDDLQVASEDVVYDFVLKWARTHYPNLEERREILGSRLCHLIRFPYMTCSKLRKVLTCNDFDPELASKNVLGALFFKAEAPHRQRLLVAEEGNASCSSFVERAYKFRPIKVLNFELPFQQCIVYLDLNRQECNNLFPAGRIYSEAFHLGGQGFYLSARCNMDQQNSFHWFGMFLSMQEQGLETFTVDFDFAALTTLSEDYVSRFKGSHTFTRGKGVGFRNLVGIPWTTFIAQGSVYFINGVLRLRAVLTARQ